MPGWELEIKEQTRCFPLPTPSARGEGNFWQAGGVSFSSTTGSAAPLLYPYEQPDGQSIHGLEVPLSRSGLSPYPSLMVCTCQRCFGDKAGSGMKCPWRDVQTMLQLRPQPSSISQMDMTIMLLPGQSLYPRMHLQQPSVGNPQQFWGVSSSSCSLGSAFSQV